MNLDNQIFDRIIDALDNRYVESCEIKLSPGSTYTSIVVKSPGTVYRAYKDTGDLLFARLKTAGKNPYISFNKKYGYLFKDSGVPFYSVKSDSDFIRISLNDFIEFIENSAAFVFVMQKIFTSIFTVDTFGCCSTYLECSDARECIHPDPIFALGCYYGKNLSAGRIFYGKNRNSVLS